ncbi:hypothetical protein HY995_00135 [Candidatus Micrarchaeota archaeon]|nr:hypothetical protein [Candidatus Micrarchaeota archaeon]
MDRPVFIGLAGALLLAAASLVSAQSHATSGTSSFDAPPQPPVEGAKEEFTIMFREGWSLFSVPLYYDGPSLCTAEGACTADYRGRMPKVKENTCDVRAVYGFDGARYVKSGINYLQSGRGYWLNAQSPCAITFEGNNRLFTQKYSQPLNAGWNLVGTPMDKVGLDQLENDCRITSGPWRYAGGKFVKEDSVTGGRAYWVKSANDCTLAAKQ